MPRRSDTRITDFIVERLQPGNAAWDADVTGFGVVGNARSKSYKFKYVYSGRQRLLTIGTHGRPWTVDAARKQAMAYLFELRAGADPFQTKRAVSELGGALCESCNALRDQTATRSGAAEVAVEGLGRASNNPYVVARARSERALQSAQTPWAAFRETVRIASIRIHDVRRNFASFASAQRMPLAIIGKLLGYKNVRTAAPYAPLTDLPQADNAIGEHTKGIAGQKNAAPRLLETTEVKRPVVFDTLIEH